MRPNDDDSPPLVLQLVQVWPGDAQAILHSQAEQDGSASFVAGANDGFEQHGLDLFYGPRVKSRRG